LINDTLYFERVDCSSNKLRFSDLPLILAMNEYNYTAQSKILSGKTITYLDTVDLSNEYNIDGNITEYVWYDITANYYMDEDIVQPVNTGGVFTFTAAHQNKRLRCYMTNGQFPFLDIEYETIIVDGISDSLLSSFVIFPNPSLDSEEIFISFGLLESSDVTFMIYDLLSGDYYNLSDFYDIGSHIVPFDVSDLSVGTYVCRMLVGGRQVGLVSFVVAR
jgi:hypothetical protein